MELIVFCIVIAALVFFLSSLLSESPETKQPFKPLTGNTSQLFRESSSHVGHHRSGPVCFVTGMSRTSCACAECARGSQ